MLQRMHAAAAALVDTPSTHPPCQVLAPPPLPMERPESDTVVPLNVLLDVVDPEPVAESDTQDAEATLEEVLGPTAALLAASRRAAQQQAQQTGAVVDEGTEVVEVEDGAVQEVVEVVEELHVDEDAVVDMEMDMHDVLRGLADDGEQDAVDDDDGLAAARERLETSMDGEDHERDTTVCAVVCCFVSDAYCAGSVGNESYGWRTWRKVQWRYAVAKLGRKRDEKHKCCMLAQDAMESLMEGLSEQHRQAAAARVVASIDEALAAFASSLQPAARAALESARSAAAAAGADAGEGAAEVGTEATEVVESAEAPQATTEEQLTKLPAMEQDATSLADAVTSELPAEEAVSIKEEADAIAQKLQAYEDVIARILRYEPVDAPLGLAAGLPDLRSSDEEEESGTEAVLEEVVEVVEEVEEVVEVVEEVVEVVDEVEEVDEVVEEVVEEVEEVVEVVDEVEEVVEVVVEEVDEVKLVAEAVPEEVDTEEPAAETASLQAPADPVQEPPQTPPPPALQPAPLMATPRPMDIADGVTRSADALALARASLDRSIMESEGALEDLEGLLQDLDAEKQQLKQSANLFEEVRACRLVCCVCTVT